MQLDEDGDFWKYALHSFFGELGDKAFFVTVLLSGWVASWETVRSSRRVFLHQLIVFAAASCGLAMHVVWDSLHTRVALHAHSIHVAGMVIMAFLGVWIHLDLRKFEKASHQSWCEESSQDKQSGHEAISWNPLSKRFTSPRDAPNASWNSLAFGYGSVDPPACDLSDVIPECVYEEATPSKVSSLQSFISAGLLTVVLIFVVEVGDQAQYSLFLSAGNQSGAKLVLSSMIGYIVATFTAMFVGHIMERTFPDPYLLFATELGFFCMALMCFSQAVLGLSTFAIAHKATAFLGLEAVAHA